MTVYVDDISVGMTSESTRRTITKDDIAAFAQLSGDFNPLILE